ncbi:PBAN-type neuropeptides-like [Sitophilus oryzae]|uniref:PBAN-type neuropeptides-like n=1 Tax=Sitophilus oryzae TaxID=7048 RepID=A0A6J2XD51_SITOR|nr:PBAN-type neuropeptides-like [Sitophilus oryzae]
MGRVTLTNSFVLLAVLLYSVIERTESSDPTTLNLHNEKEASPMWFGPRIGRKKRNQENRGYRNDRDQSGGLMDILRNGPVLVMSMSEASKQRDFIPRLGRESAEAVPKWLDDSEFSEGEPLSTRNTNPYTPRLGRSNFSLFFPRLGRELE